MDTGKLNRVSGTEWQIEPSGSMRVPAIIYADERLIDDMDDKVLKQVAKLHPLACIQD